MINTYNPVSDVRNESVDLTKRLYRAITDASRQLDERRGTAQTCDDLFVPSLEAQRVKLREYCERLMFLDPLGYGQKAEEILWRKGYYDVVSTAKRLRKNNKWSPLETAYMQTHLSSGVGHFHHLMCRLQIELKLDLRGLIDIPLLINDEGLVKGKTSSSKVIDEECIKWAKKTAHRFLVYLGDLSRYFLDLYPGWDTGLTVRYYLQALNLNSDVGMPHNQLGTLFGTRNYSIDSAYHYMRCLMSQQSFDGAESNLQRIFEKNNRWLEDRYCERGNIGEKVLTPSEHVHCLIARFLLLADIWFFDKPVLHINELCHQIVGDLVECLKYNAPLPSDMDLKVDMENSLSVENEEIPEYLKDDVIFKIVVMSLLCAGKLQSSNSGQHSIAVAFILGVLSKLSQLAVDHIQNSVFNRSLTSFMPLLANCTNIQVNAMKPELTKPTTSQHVETCHTTSASRVIQSDPLAAGKKEIVKEPKEKKNKLKNLRRRRRRRSANSSDDSDVQDDIDSEGSDNEEHLAFSTDDEVGEDSGNECPTDHVPIIRNGNNSAKCVGGPIIKNGESGLKVNGYKLNESISIVAKEMDLKAEGAVETYQTTSEPKHCLDPADLIEQVAGDRILDIVKILLDWLRGDSAVVDDCSINSRDLLNEIVLLLNLINLDAKLLKLEPIGAKIYKLKDMEKVFNKVPLPEDVDIKNIGLRSFKKVHDAIDWEYLRYRCLHSKEEALLRVYKLVDFGHFLVSKPDLGVSYDSELRRFILADDLPAKKAEIGNKCRENGSKFSDQQGWKRTNESNTPRKDAPRPPKGALMKNMHALWLRGEVKALESQKRSRDPVFSPYLAVDVEALIHYTPLVKQLVGARKFILLIPTVVMAALDDLKGEVPRAREINRWLGLQHEKVNRFVRVQGPNEQMPIPLIKYPKKKDKEAWMFFQVVECCQYFNTKYGSNPNVPLVTLLTGHRHSSPVANEDLLKGFSPIGIAKTAGISLENIETFHSKWKTSSKSHG